MTLLDELLLETYRLAQALDYIVEDMVESLPIIPNPTITPEHTYTTAQIIQTDTREIGSQLL